MGLVRAQIWLENPTRRERQSPVCSTCLVDTGAVHLCLPEALALQLGFDLDVAESRTVTTATGESRRVPYVGPIKVTFGNRSCFVGALVLGTEPLLGSVPMEDLDLVVIPSTQTLSVNPESPEIPTAIVKQST